MAGAMPSTLCAASKKVSAQGKRKWTEAKPKPQQKVIYSTLQNPLMKETKNSHTHTLEYKTKTQSRSSIQVNLQFLKPKQ